MTERNVLAELPGETDETIVVCAHYDTAWRAGGAVDNASGVEGVRRIVERLAGRPHRRTLLAIAFGAEELGLSGARFFVHDAKTRGELGRIKRVVNLECLARGERLELWAAPDDLKERGLRIAASSASAICPRDCRSREATTSRSRARGSRPRASSAGRTPSTTCRRTTPASPTKRCSLPPRSSHRGSSRSCSTRWSMPLRVARLYDLVELAVDPPSAADMDTSSLGKVERTPCTRSL